MCVCNIPMQLHSKTLYLALCHASYLNDTFANIIYYCYRKVNSILTFPFFDGILYNIVLCDMFIELKSIECYEL